MAVAEKIKALLGRAKEGRAQIAELLVASDSGGDQRDEGEGNRRSSIESKLWTAASRV
jgi:hypothetical protein